MGVKPDHWIRKMALEQKMIEPFEEGLYHKGMISYGVSSYGYDIRIADEFKIFNHANSSIIDPKNFDTASMVDFKGDVCVIPANSFVLGRTVEYLRIPRGVGNDLPREEHLCPLWNYCERHSIRARMGRIRHHGNFQYHPAAGENLCQ